MTDELEIWIPYKSYWSQIILGCLSEEMRTIRWFSVMLDVT